MVTITTLTQSSNHLCLVICLSAKMTKCKVCKAVWSHRAMLHLAVPDKARNSTTLSPPSCFPTSFTVDNPSDLPELAPFVLGSPPITQKEQTNNFTEMGEVLTFADKKVLSLQNKVIRTKTFILCNTYHLHLSSSVDNSHKASLTLQIWSALHLCTSPPSSCHMFQRPNPHPSVLHAIMDERF